MPNVLVTAVRARGTTREFVNYAYLSRFTRIPSNKLKTLGVFDGLYYRYDPQGHKEFRTTDAMKALAQWRLMPPDNLHPLYEFSLAGAMNELGVRPITLMKYIKSGKLRTHISEVDGNKKVYRKDIEYFRRNWDARVMASHMLGPLRRTVCALVMGLKMVTFRRKERDKVIVPLPRKPGEYTKFSKAEVLRVLDLKKVKSTRKYPLPEQMSPELAAMYCGFSRLKLERLKELNLLRPEYYLFPDGKRRWIYHKADLDRVFDADQAREFYCDGLPYYTRKAIRYKFFKTDRWIDKFIRGKCRTMRSKTEIIQPGEHSDHVAGWVREDVEAVVASGVDFKVRKKRPPLARKVKQSLSIKATSTPPVAFSSPVEQMEAAIHAAMNEKAEAKAKRRNEVREKMLQERARMKAIRNVLSTGELNKPMAVSRTDMLRYATERQLVTFLIGATTWSKQRYKEYPHTKDEQIFTVTCGAVLGRRVIPPSFSRAVCNALQIFNSYKFEMVPAWVIIVSNTSIINDPMFHTKLKAVPVGVGAVGAYGYGYLLPDGSWDGCSATYGSYGVYSEITGSSRKVEGLASTAGSHMVEMLDGPFIAIRGEYMQELALAKFFNQLGDARGLLVPVISSICRRQHIPMQQISVDCWSSEEFEVRPGTPEMNLGIERISQFAAMSDADIKEYLSKGKK